MSTDVASDKVGSNINRAYRAEIVARLRARLQDRRGTMPRIPLAPLIDETLPWDGLACGGWHEIAAAGEANRNKSGAENGGAATAFAAALLAGSLKLSQQSRRCVIWLPRSRGLYMPGLSAFGLPPDQVLVVRTADDTARLWAAEEALRCTGIAGVLAEVDAVPPVAARRLQLAAERGGTFGLALQTTARKTAGNSHVALTRWQVVGVPSQPENGLPGVGAPRWRLDLLHCRGGRPGSWLVEWRGAGNGLAVIGTPRGRLTDPAPHQKSWRQESWRLAG